LEHETDGRNPFSPTVFARFPDDDACLAHVMEVRYGLRHVSGPAEVVPDVKKKTLEAVVTRQVQEGATISTDELRSYNLREVSNYEWGAVNHGKRNTCAASTTSTTSSRSGICSRCRLLQLTSTFQRSISTNICGNLLSGRNIARARTRCLICLWRVFDKTRC
jgi:hypothetical protein